MEATKTYRLLLDNVSNHKYLISIIGFVIALAAVFYAVFEMTKNTVTVSIDGNEEVILSTHAETIADLFAEEDWDTNQHDLIEPSLDTPIDEDKQVLWKQAKEVAVTIDGETEDVWTTQENVSGLLDELSIEYKEQDELEPNADTMITNNMNVQYQPAFLVTLLSDGEEQDIWTTSTTVADFLDREEIELGDLDRVEPILDDHLDKETEVQVTRVEKVTDVVEESISYETITKNDDKLNKGTEKVEEEGKEGVLKNTFEVVLEDGEEVTRELVKTETVEDRVDRVVAVGTREEAPAVAANDEQPVREKKQETKIASETVEAPASEPKSEKSFTMTATAYTVGCAGCSGVTATGIDLNSNRNMKVVAVDPSVIPLGSKVHVEGYGTAIAGDTGGAINGNKIDLHVPSQAEAERFGRKQVKVTIVE
ncbi:G5 and 3D domain-containing protein [Alkalicoccobacillus plakortidis]|uniref:G5 and 3D domain-containing protein n=1 Tax=Alkalicoccobacillus plakortidis TaxID=444060 RepID=UPI00255817F8|nr:G5 and 3D domain-containing protein [Alkalicoccobacillus plakortidis]